MNLPEYIQCVNNANQRFRDRISEASKLLQTELAEANNSFYGSMARANIEYAVKENKELRKEEPSW